jgi:hypothetical protein
MVDRRLSSRFPCHGQATLLFAGTCRTATVLDLSMEGALVRPAAPRGRDGLTAGAPCTVRIFSAAGDALLTVPAKVAHSADGRIGLALSQVGGVAERMLHQLIEFNLGTRALARRDSRGLS